MIRTRVERVSDDDDSAFDRNGLLKDGRTARFTMMMHDADSVGRAIAEDRARATVHDGSGGGELALHRPGYRYVGNAVASERAKLASYDAMCRDMCDAWRRDAQPSYGPYEARREGESCTIDGQPGKLERSEDGRSMICRPSRSDAAADARHRIKTVHRDPAGREVGTSTYEFEYEPPDDDDHRDRGEDSVPRSMSAADSWQIRSEAWHRMLDEQAEAWRPK
jgi:hypothetical protein